VASERGTIAQKIANLRAELSNMAGLVGLMNGSGELTDDLSERIRFMRQELHDLESELRAMNEDAPRA
jgi:hypothetical protein